MMPRVNHGALFGIGQNQKGLANGIFAAVSVLAAVAIMVWGTRRNTAREKGLMAALGLILGGTVGNLYDRLIFGGVRDFLYFYRIEWPVFNVADCCLVVVCRVATRSSGVCHAGIGRTARPKSNRPFRKSPRSDRKRGRTRAAANSAWAESVPTILRASRREPARPCSGSLFGR